MKTFIKSIALMVLAIFMVACQATNNPPGKMFVTQKRLSPEEVALALKSNRLNQDPIWSNGGTGKPMFAAQFDTEIRRVGPIQNRLSKVYGLQLVENNPNGQFKTEFWVYNGELNFWIAQQIEVRRPQPGVFSVIAVHRGYNPGQGNYNSRGKVAFYGNGKETLAMVRLGLKEYGQPWPQMPGSLSPEKPKSKPQSVPRPEPELLEQKTQWPTTRA